MIYAAIYAAIGIFGYELWKNPTKKMIRYGLIAGITLAAVTMSPLAASANIASESGTLLKIDSGALLILAAIYLIGTWIVHKQINLGLDKKRDS